MLNDIISLFIALWAIRMSGTTQDKVAPKYTYGWQRAEILGALVNGVFLIALCVSIFLEAIQRFVEPQNISKPLLIVAVGSAGLVSNLVGLFLFHEHGHSHGGGGGGGGHDHGSAGHEHEHNHIHGRGHGDVDLDTDLESMMPENVVRRARSLSMNLHRRSSMSGDDIYVHPAQNRAAIHDLAISHSRHGSHSSEQSPLLRVDQTNDHTNHNHAKPKDANGTSHGDGHGHGGGGGHNHQNMNMRAVFLHVLGDALGNIGVIATGLFVYFTSFSWRFYADPVISLVITLIILTSAIPLVKSASLILLQVAPPGIHIDDIKQDIESIEGVCGVHELHVWQLSDVKLIASVHVTIASTPPPSSSANLSTALATDGTLTTQGGAAGRDGGWGQESQGRYMAIAGAIKTCLHAFGIHSCTIQPEFIPLPSFSSSTNTNITSSSPSGTISNTGKNERGGGGLRTVQEGDEGECLLDCVGGPQCEPCCSKPVSVHGPE